MTTRSRSRRSFGRRTRGARRKTTWENLFIEHAHGTAGEEKVTDLSPEPMATDGIGTATLLRSIMQYSFMIDSNSSTTTPQQLALGMTVLTNDAFAALAVPDPLSDFQQDWYYWVAKAKVFDIDAGPQSIDWEADIRSARRLRGGFKLAVVSQSPASNDIDTTCFITLRNLWAIP